jgi:glycosyltransferase involved in cell wall biosynthesis
MATSKSILVVIHSLGGGGAERTLVDLTACWASRGDRVTLVTLSHARDDAYVLHPDINRIVLDVAGESSGLLQGILANLHRVLALRKVFKTIAPDVVLGFMTTSSVLAVFAALGLPVRVIASEHTHPTHQSLSALWRLLRKIAYPLARTVVTLTEGTAEWIKHNMPHVRLRVIPNPVVWPVANREPVFEPPPKIANRKRLLAVGRLHPEKGFDLLIDAFKLIATRQSDWDLVILGEGGARGSLQAQIDQAGLADRIAMPGRVGNMADWYASADMYVLSSRVEGLSNTLLESMAMGLPVVAFDCDTGPRAIITHGLDGLLVRPNGDREALAQALLTLIVDEPLQQKLRSAAPLVRERFSLMSVIARWDQLLEEVA